jgi:hypothetical protein
MVRICGLLLDRRSSRRGRRPRVFRTRLIVASAARVLGMLNGTFLRAGKHRRLGKRGGGRLRPFKQVSPACLNYNHDYHPISHSLNRSHRRYLHHATSHSPPRLTSSHTTLPYPTHLPSSHTRQTTTPPARKPAPSQSALSYATCPLSHQTHAQHLSRETFGRVRCGL